MSGKNRDHSGGLVIDAETGESHEYHERKPFTYMKNDKRSNDFLAINVKAWKAGAALLIALASIVGTVHATMVYIYEPRLRQTIQAEVQPLSLELAAERRAMQAHLLEETRADGDRIRRAELEAKLERIEAKLDALYRSR